MPAARDAEHAVAALEAILATDRVVVRARRSAAVRAESWEARITDLVRVVERVRQARAA